MLFKYVSLKYVFLFLKHVVLQPDQCRVEHADHLAVDGDAIDHWAERAKRDVVVGAGRDRCCCGARRE